jgi:hypothetical protein
MEIITQRSTRSKSIDCSLSLIDEIILNKKKEALQTPIINNELPAHIRSISWRVALNILPIDRPEDWIQITEAYVQSFNVLNNDEEIERFGRVFNGEMNEDVIASSNLFYDYKVAKEEIERLSTFCDFFKCASFGESLIRLYLIWLKQFDEVDKSDRIKCFYILACIYYSLFPSIQNNTYNGLKTDPKFILYSLNLEENFDSDVFNIFDNIMNHKGLRRIMNDFTKMENNDISEKVECMSLNDQEIDKDFIKSLNYYQRVSFFHMKLINNDLLKHLFSIKLDIYEIIHSWVTSLFTSAIQFEKIVYLWDNIFYFSDNDSLSFIDNICVSMINVVSDELKNSTLNDCK